MTKPVDGAEALLDGRDDLFGPTFRKARRIMAHATDAGSFPDGKDCAQFECSKCDYDSGWIYAARTEVRRGIPCPLCNTPRTALETRNG